MFPPYVSMVWWRRSMSVNAGHGRNLVVMRAARTLNLEGCYLATAITSSRERELSDVSFQI